jgi:hypothetical protein
MHQSLPFLDCIIVKHKPNIPRPLLIIPHEVLVSLRPLLLRITRQHALQAHANRLDVLDRRPPAAVQQVEADDAVGVDVWVVWDRVRVGLDEDYFRWLRSNVSGLER